VGALESAPFKEGDLVRKGDLIFQIQQSEYLAAYRTAQAQLATARAQGAQAKGNLYSREAALARANTTVARDRPLAADKAIPQKDLDNAIQNAAIASGDVDVARAQIESASAAAAAGQAAVDTAHINLGYTTINAPVTGLIGFLNYDVGNVVGGPGAQVLDTISTIDPIKITFGLDEPTYLALSSMRGTETGAALRDQDLRVVLANDESYPYPGRVYAVSPTVDPKTGSITVEARFPNPAGLLRPGGFARVRVITEQRRNAVLVPQTAIVKSQGVDTVYVIDSKNVAALRTVTLGPQYQQSYVVESGLQAGDRVVTVGTQKVRPDQKVVIKTN
jgi:membrane fusion protein (multidrug efflux system)